MADVVSAAADPPANLAASNVAGTRFTLSWNNPGHTVSNRVDLFEVKITPQKGDVAQRIDFDNLSNGKNSQECTSRITSAYPELSGYRLYMPTNSSGIIQISNSENTGWLALAVHDSLTTAALAVSSRKHPKTAKKTMLEISLATGSATNAIASISPGMDFATNVFEIGEIAADSSILLSAIPVPANTGDRRIQIDEITLFGNYSPMFAATNALPPIFVANAERLRVNGLRFNSRYLARVAAFMDDGSLSEPSASIEVDTKRNDPETIFLIK